MTQKDIDNFPYHGKYQVGPYCKLCSPSVIMRRQDSWGVRYIPRKRRHHVAIKLGEKVVMVTFRNGTLAYYHESCWNDPDNKEKVESIKKQGQ